MEDVGRESGFKHGGGGAVGEVVGARCAGPGEGEEIEVVILGGEDWPHDPTVCIPFLVVVDSGATKVSTGVEFGWKT